jgi:hypothetical protein
MRVIVYILLAGLLHSEDDHKDRRRAERRLSNLEARAKAISTLGAGADSSRFLEDETRRLIGRCRTFPLASYEFERMLEAVDDLLDARENLQTTAPQQRRTEKDREHESRGATAKRLERAYFRVQQAQYFARLSGDNEALEYIPLSRQFYQRARAAYDSQEYGRANRLASASSELVNVLENLAQAAVRRPEPPILK